MLSNLRYQNPKNYRAFRILKDIRGYSQFYDFTK